VSIIDILSSLLLFIGLFLSLSGAIGLFRFPDFFTRVHASSVTDSAGLLFMIAGLLLQTSFDLETAKLLFIAAFMLVTCPTASHALAKSARRGGLLTMHEKHPDSNEAQS